MPGILGRSVAVASAAFLAVTFAQAASNGSSHPRDMQSEAPALSQGVNAKTKASRLEQPMMAAERKSVTTVELIGVDNATVILRDKTGHIVYKSEPETNTTFFSKNTDLPVITLKEEETSPVTQKAIQPAKETEGASEQPKRKPTSVGCSGALSPLVKSEASRTPTLCLT